MGFCASTTPIPAEGRAGTLEIAKNHGFLHLDHADPRRGSRGNFRNRKRPWVFAPRPCRSPQRVDFRVVSSALPRRPKKRFYLLASQLHLTPCACNLHSTPCTCNLHLTPCTCNLHLTPCTCNLHLTPCTCNLHLTPCAARNDSHDSLQ